MKTDELRKGNLINFYRDNTIGSVSNIEEQYIDFVSLNTGFCCYDKHIDYFEPIELTKDILENLKFSVGGECSFYSHIREDGKEVSIKYYTWANGETCIELVILEKRPLCESIFKRNIKYLHQLQNLYYLLTEEEFDIKGLNI